MQPHSNDSPPSAAERLQRLNEAIANDLVPAIIVLGILVVFGIVGNILVCVVFGFRLRMCTQHFLIVTLAVFDLLTCFITLPSEMVAMRYDVMYGSDSACRTLKFIAVFTSMASCYTLVVIAVDRYTKICRPWNGRMSLRHAKMALVAVVAVSCVFTSPSPLLAGNQTYNITDPRTRVSSAANVTDSRSQAANGTALLLLPIYPCTGFASVRGTKYPLIYYAAALTGSVAAVVVLTVLYVRIWWTIRTHNRKMQRVAAESFPLQSLDPAQPSESSSESTPELLLASSPLSTRQPLSSSPSSSSLPTQKPPSPSPPSTQKPSSTSTPRPPSSSSSTPSNLQPPSPLSLITSTPNSPSPPSSLITTPNSPSPSSPPTPESPSTSTPQRMSPPSSPITSTSAPVLAKTLTREAKTRTLPQQPAKPTTNTNTLPATVRTSKATVIAVSVTVVFFLSFIPYFLLEVSKVMVGDYQYRLRGANLVLHHIFLRFPFVNAVANPFIYSVLNRSFRAECFKLLPVCFFSCCRRSNMDEEDITTPPVCFSSCRSSSDQEDITTTEHDNVVEIET